MTLSVFKYGISVWLLLDFYIKQILILQSLIRHANLLYQCPHARKKEIIQVRHNNKFEDFVDYLMVDNVIYIRNEILGKVGKLIHLNLAEKPPPSNSEIDKTIYYGI